MPGFATHYLFGVKNLQQLKRSAACEILFHSIDSYKTVFQLGLQGPDVFFYHLASQVKKGRPGSVTHKTWTGDFLKSLIQVPELFWKQDECSIAQAYAAGFIGHYILDTQMHPYVYYKTGYGAQLKVKGYAEHICLESDIDTCNLMRYAKCLPSEFHAGQTIAFDMHTRSVVAEILYHAYHAVYPEMGLSKGFFSRAIRSMQIGTRLTYNPRNNKRQFVEKIEQIVIGHPEISPVIPIDEIIYDDPLNLQHKPWYNPWNRAACFNQSVPQMIKKASIRYQTVFKQLESLYQADQLEDVYDASLEKLCQLLGQQSYHSGLDWTLGE